MTYDPDQLDPQYLRMLVQLLQSPLDHIREMILHPKGGTPESIEWNRSRATRTWYQIAEQIRRARQDLANWTGRAITSAAARGWREGRRQLDLMNPQWRSRGTDPSLKASFNIVDFDAVHALARDTYANINAGLQATEDRLRLTLRRMADNGLTAADVDLIQARGTIEGKPRQVIRDLRDELLRIHGKELTIPTKTGGTMSWDTREYAQLVAHTRLREASVIGRHERLTRAGVDHVIIIGNITKYPCTAFLGKIYYIGDGRDPSGYPNLNTVKDARGHAAPPFHPNCSKSTAPIVLDLATPEEIRRGQPDATSEQMAQVGVNSTAGVRLMQADNVRGQARERMAAIAESIRAEARRQGYRPPPWSPKAADLESEKP